MTARLVTGLVRTSLARSVAPAASTTFAPPRRRRRSHHHHHHHHHHYTAAAASASRPRPASVACAARLAAAGAPPPCMLCDPATADPVTAAAASAAASASTAIPDARPSTATACPPTPDRDRMPAPAVASSSVAASAAACRPPFAPSNTAPVAECGVVVAAGMGVAVLAEHVSSDPEFMDYETQHHHDTIQSAPPSKPSSVTTATTLSTSTTSLAPSAQSSPTDANHCMHSLDHPETTHPDEDDPACSAAQPKQQRTSYCQHRQQQQTQQNQSPHPSSSQDRSSPSDPATSDSNAKETFLEPPALSTSTVTSSDASSSLTESSSPAKSTDDPSSNSSPASPLALRSAVVCIPHPEKAEKGGEDAFFIHNHALGVFDGVGGWASIGVDAGLYSKELARLTANYVANEGPAAVVDALKSATDNNRAIGSSTACVVGMDGAQLVGVNVGDSGLVVIRDARIVYQTKEQQHYFNCPFQIGTDSLDTVEVGGPIEVQLQHGDWIIMGTDGLWDNVFPNTIVDIVNSNQSPPDANEGSPSGKQSSNGDSSSDGGSAASDCSASGSGAFGEEAQSIAQKLAECAVKVANDERGSSPFAVNAQNAGHLFLGGKVDDITIIAAVVVDPEFEFSGKCGLEEVRIGDTTARTEE